MDTYTTIEAFMAIWSVVATFDVISTNKALALGCVEVNPLPRFWQKISPKFWYIFHFGLLAPIFLTIGLYISPYAILAAAALELAVVAHNFEIINSVKKGITK